MRQTLFGPPVPWSLTEKIYKTKIFEIDTVIVTEKNAIIPYPFIPCNSSW